MWKSHVRQNKCIGYQDVDYILLRCVLFFWSFFLYVRDFSGSPRLWSCTCSAVQQSRLYLLLECLASNLQVPFLTRLVAPVAACQLRSQWAVRWLWFLSSSRSRRCHQIHFLWWDWKNKPAPGSQQRCLKLILQEKIVCYEHWPKRFLKVRVSQSGFLTFFEF